MDWKKDNNLIKSGRAIFRSRYSFATIEDISFVIKLLLGYMLDLSYLVCQLFGDVIGEN